MRSFAMKMLLYAFGKDRYVVGLAREAESARSLSVAYLARNMSGASRMRLADPAEVLSVKAGGAWDL